MCEHKNFEAASRVNRLSENDGGPINAYALEVAVQCLDCKLPFRFIVPRVGLDPNDATITANGQELCVYIEPSDGSLVDGVRAGYRISVLRPEPGPSKN
jgi:hypothetical protein